MARWRRFGRSCRSVADLRSLRVHPLQRRRRTRRRRRHSPLRRRGCLPMRKHHPLRKRHQPRRAIRNRRLVLPRGDDSSQTARVTSRDAGKGEIPASREWPCGSGKDGDSYRRPVHSYPILLPRGRKRAHFSRKLPNNYLLDNPPNRILHSPHGGFR